MLTCLLTASTACAGSNPDCDEAQEDERHVNHLRQLRHDDPNVQTYNFKMLHFLLDVVSLLPHRLVEVLHLSLGKKSSTNFLSALASFLQVFDHNS